MVDKSELRRELGVALLTGLGIGGVIGSGAYVNLGLIASVAGPSSTLSVLIMTLITAMLLYIIAELGREYPRAGAIYYFVRDILGDLPGFVTSLSFYVCSFAGTAAIIYAFILYLSHYIPELSVGFTLTPLGTLIAIAILIAVTFLNIIGVRYGAGLNFILVISRVLPLVIFTVLGLLRTNVDNFEPFTPYSFKGIALAVAFGFWMFVGFEGLVLVGEEVKAPEKTIRKSALYSMAIISLIYILLTLSFIGSIDWKSLGITEKDWSAVGRFSAPLSDVSKAWRIPGVAELMFLGAAISSAGCFSSWVLYQARVAFALAREKRLWQWLAKVHPVYGTPYTALIFSSTLTAITMVLIPSFPSVTLIATITEFIPYSISALCYTISRYSVQAIVLGFLGFFFSTLYIYWACWPWTLMGFIIAIASFTLYASIYAQKSFVEELRRSLWYIVYLAFLPIISLLGDRVFVYNNFLPIEPLGILSMPIDTVFIAIFTVGIYIWALKTYGKL